MQDKIEIIGTNSWIQHGKVNDRVYLMKIDKNETTEIIRIINELARKNNYSKIFCKVPAGVAPIFTADGFIIESQIPNFFKGEESVFFMSKFLNSDRLLGIETDDLKTLSQILSASRTETFQLSSGIKKRKVKKLEAEDSVRMAELYKKVFMSYPFPIFDPAYIRKSMNSGVQYFGIEKRGKLVALASAEVNAEEENAEMTDFATLPDHRGKKYAISILRNMETSMKKEGIKSLYTIARLRSHGMNLTFLRLNYRFAGTLLKNTNISGNIESMNIYYKHI